jgi:hypothetical protein
MPANGFPGAGLLPRHAIGPAPGSTATYVSPEPATPKPTAAHSELLGHDTPVRSDVTATGGDHTSLSTARADPAHITADSSINAKTIPEPRRQVRTHPTSNTTDRARDSCAVSIRPEHAVAIELQPL